MRSMVEGCPPIERATPLPPGFAQPPPPCRGGMETATKPLALVRRKGQSARIPDQF